MRERRRLWPVIRRIWISVGLAATAVFVVWSFVAYRASAEAKRAAKSDARVTVTQDDAVWRFEPAAGAEPPTLVFIPGALVDPLAYAPLARSVAQAGYRALLVELPYRGAFGGAESPELHSRLASALASARGPIVLGGHSRGAVVASAAAAQHASTLGGLVLIGTSHPRDVDLHDLAAPVTKIVGTRDGLASRAKVEQNAGLLPPHTRWIWVEGGNHSQFGWYGFQPLDRRPRIGAAEQRAIMTEGVLEILRSVAQGA